jgi:TPP-dependent pyruvate/acetoin dehydrogenase alpha subunit
MTPLRQEKEPGLADVQAAQKGDAAAYKGDAAAQQSAAATPEQLARFFDGYCRMHVIRLFETAMHRLFLAGEVHGTTHLGAGQEAVAVGTCLALRPDDYVAGTYRGHGHALAKGTPPEPLIAEMLGRATGVCGGRAGSMNVVDIEHGLIGCYGIVGGSIAAAVGAALSGKRQGRVAVAFFGDGAVNQAYFHECLNMAKVFLLPAVFVCENNFYGEFTPMASVTAGGDIAARARAYDIPSSVVDGNDMWAVYEAASEAVERARSGDGPTLLECQTYRHYGHSKSDPAPYRPKEEVERWLARDPLKLARARLLDDGVPEEQLDELEGQANSLIERAVEAAVAAPYPDPDETAATEFSG